MKYTTSKELETGKRRMKNDKIENGKIFIIISISIIFAIILMNAICYHFVEKNKNISQTTDYELSLSYPDWLEGTWQNSEKSNTDNFIFWIIYNNDGIGSHIFTTLNTFLSIFRKYMPFARGLMSMVVSGDTADTGDRCITCPAILEISIIAFSRNS